MRLLLLKFFLLAATVGYAQIGGRLSYLNPLGELGFVVKKAPSLEVTALTHYDDRLSGRLSIGFAYLSPRMDTIPTISYYSVVGAIPSRQAFSNLTHLTLTTGFDWNIIDLDPFYVYPGLDMYGGFLIGRYYDDVPTVFVPYTQSIFYKEVGCRVRLGARYVLNDTWALALEGTRSQYISEGYGFGAYWDIGIGVNYVW